MITVLYIQIIIFFKIQSLREYLSWRAVFFFSFACVMLSFYRIIAGVCINLFLSFCGKILKSDRETQKIICNLLFNRLYEVIVMYTCSCSLVLLMKRHHFKYLSMSNKVRIPTSHLGARSLLPCRQEIKDEWRDCAECEADPISWRHCVSGCTVKWWIQ